jgi:hypothetical protein
MGSTKTMSAKAGSDIDLLVNFAGGRTLKKELQNWFDGWSLALDEINYLRTGYKAGGLLDVHFIDDEGIERNRNSLSHYDLNSDCCRELPLALKSAEAIASK